MLEFCGGDIRGIEKFMERQREKAKNLIFLCLASMHACMEARWVSGLEDY